MQNSTSRFRGDARSCRMALVGNARTGLPVQEERLRSLPMRSAEVRTSKSGYSAGRCLSSLPSVSSPDRSARGPRCGARTAAGRQSRPCGH